jgi:hypothetical protein
MKKLVAIMLGLATSTVVFGQSYIWLDTFNSSVVAPYPLITYGASGSPVPAGSGMMVGFYYSTTAATFETGSTGNGSNFGIPGAEWTLATGLGSTAQFLSSDPGLFSTVSAFSIPGIVSTAWIIVVVYNGASYETAPGRAHSEVFTISPVTVGQPQGMGESMQGFAIPPLLVVPEPSTFALTALGIASLCASRRRV